MLDIKKLGEMVLILLDNKLECCPPKKHKTLWFL